MLVFVYFFKIREITNTNFLYLKMVLLNNDA